MRSISDTIRRLQHVSKPRALDPMPAAASRLTPLHGFGTNPGDLDAFLFAPAHLPQNAPLVVVLHGCTQTASAYDQGSGWSALADRFGFAVLFPQQRRSNNPNLCFNWFSPADARAGAGETESIRQMTCAVIERHAIDPVRVFVTGLSAGGAMTSAMLATCPNLFAGGAIIAGLPFGVAKSVPEAFDRMRGHGYDSAGLSALIRDAAPSPIRWPSISIWQGTADTTVAPVNAAMLVEQWRGIHGVELPDQSQSGDRHRYRGWHDSKGRLVLEEYLIPGLGHGTPITSAGPEAFGVPAPYMLEAGISSTYRIAASWGIVPAVAPARPEPAASDATPASGPARHGETHGFDPGRSINAALRAAGLLRP